MGADHGYYVVSMGSFIGNALATRDLLTHLRDIGINTNSLTVFGKTNRS